MQQGIPRRWLWCAAYWVIKHLRSSFESKIQIRSSCVHRCPHASFRFLCRRWCIFVVCPSAFLCSKYKTSEAQGISLLCFRNWWLQWNCSFHFQQKEKGAGNQEKLEIGAMRLGTKSVRCTDLSLWNLKHLLSITYVLVRTYRSLAASTLGISSRRIEMPGQDEKAFFFVHEEVRASNERFELDHFTGWSCAQQTVKKHRFLHRLIS